MCDRGRSFSWSRVAGIILSALRLSRDLELNEIAHACEAPLPIEYKGISLECGYRVDLLLEGALIIDLESVKKIDPIHEAQILTYMKLSGIQTGLMFNFNVTKLKEA